MKKASKTYHYLSALVLVLFICSTLLPLSISAASLFCKMDMSAMHQDDLATCDFHEADDSADMISLDKSPCEYQEICEQALSDSQTSIEAVPLLVQGFDAVFVSLNILPGNLAYSKTAVFQSEPVSPKATPPIFVLNSAFLN
jgi:hypothetical protein